jgi:hypothetical protein
MAWWNRTVAVLCRRATDASSDLTFASWSRVVGFTISILK